MSDRGLSTVSFSRSLPVNIDVWSAYVNTTLDMPLAAMSRLHISTRGSRTDDTVGCRFFFPTDLFRLPFLLSTVGRLFSSGSLFWGYLSILWLYSPALSFFPPQPDIPCCHDGVYLSKNSLFVCMLGCSPNLRHGHYAWRNRVSWAYSPLALSAMSSNELRRSAHIKDACYRPRTTWNLPVLISMKPIILQLITSSFYSQVEQWWRWLILKHCSRFVFFRLCYSFL